MADPVSIIVGAAKLVWTGAKLLGSALTGAHGLGWQLAALGTVDAAVSKFLPKTTGGGLDRAAPRDVTMRSAVEPRKIVYGRALVSGPVWYMNTADAGRNLWIGICLAGHEIDDVESIFFDSRQVYWADIDASTGAVTGSSAFAGHTWIWKHLGTDTQTVDTNLSDTFSDIGATHKLQGVAHIVIKFRWTDDAANTPLQAGVPRRIAALIKGKKIYDPRLDSTQTSISGSGSHRVDDSSTWTWSENPALAAADYLIDSRLGPGFATSEIDYAALAADADYCDATISEDDDAKRFTANGVLFANGRPRQNVKRLLSAMNGRMTMSGTPKKVRIEAGRYKTPTASLDESWLSGSIKIRRATPRTERINTVRAVYIDKTDGYESQESFARTVAAYVTRDGDEEMLREINLPLTDNETMAQRISHRHVLAANQMLTVDMPCNYKALNLAIHDFVQVTNSELSWTNKVFVVQGWSLGGSGGINLVLQETESTAFADPSSYTARVAGSIITYAQPDTPPPSGLAATAEVGGIALAWNLPAAPDTWDMIEVHQSSTNDRSAAAKIATSKADEYFAELRKGETRYFWIRSINAGGTASSWHPESATAGVSATAIYPGRRFLEGSLAVADGDDGAWIRIFDSSGGTTADNWVSVWSDDNNTYSSFEISWDQTANKINVNILTVTDLLAQFRSLYNASAGGSFVFDVKLANTDGDTIYGKVGPSDDVDMTTSMVMSKNPSTTGYSVAGEPVDVVDRMVGVQWTDALQFQSADRGFVVQNASATPRNAINSAGHATVDITGWTADNYNPSLDTPASATERPDGWYSTDTTVAIPAYVDGDQDTMTLSASGQVEVVNTAFAIEPNDRIKVQWRLKDSAGSGNTAKIYLNVYDGTLAQGSIAISHGATSGDSESKITQKNGTANETTHTFSSTGWEAGSTTIELLGSTSPDFASVSILLDSTTQVEYLSAEKLTNPHMPKRIAAGVSPDIAATLQGYSHAAQVYAWDGTAGTSAFTAHSIDGSGSGASQTAELYVDHGTAWGLQHWFSASALDFLIKSGATERFKIAAADGLVTIPGSLTVDGTLTTTGLSPGEQFSVTAAGNASILVDAKDASENTKIELHAKTSKSSYIDLGGEDVSDYALRLITDQTNATIHSSGALLLAPATSYVALQYAGSNKLQTTSGGISVTGDVAATTGTYSGNVTVANLSVTSTNWLGWGDYGERLSGSNAAGTLTFWTDATLALTLDNSQDATFAGSATIETGLNLESGTFVIKNATTDSSGLRIFQDASDAAKIYNNYNGTLQLGVGNTTALTIDSSENVGIGTSSGADSRLHVDSTVSYTNDYQNLGIISGFPINTVDRIYASYVLGDSETIKGAAIGLAYDGTGYKMHLATAATTSSGVSTALTLNRDQSATFAGTLDVNGGGNSNFYALQLERSGSGTAVDIWGTSNKLVLGTSASASALALASGATTVTGQMYIGPDNADRRPFAKKSNWGYSSSYKAIILGSTSTAPGTEVEGATTISFGYDPSTNSDGSFTGDGREILFRNGQTFVTPNSANDDFNQYHLVLKDGRVGIGEDSPDTPVHVKIQGEPPAPGMMILEANAGTNPGSRQLRFMPPTDSANGFMDFRGGNFTFLDDGSEVARFASSGKFGLGTNNPTSLLHIESGSSPTLTIKDTSNGCKLLAYSQDSESIIGTYSNHNLGIFTNSTRAVTIDTALSSTFHGSVFITNDTSGAYGRLEVGGEAGAYIDIKRPSSDDFDLRLQTTGTENFITGKGNYIRITPTEGSGSGALELFGKLKYYTTDDQVNYWVAYTHTDDTYRFNKNNSGNDEWMINGDGDVSIRGDLTENASTSDIRLKEEISVIPDAVEKVKALRGVVFKFKETGKAGTGLIAQEVQEVLPEAVYTAPAFKEGDDFLALRYGNTVGLLVEAIKEQQTHIDALTKRIEELETK